jgi:glycyl-tRNA synthetase beta chain
MVCEFTQLKGVMGVYYARLQGEDARVADAVAQHYRPLGPTDEVPTEPVAVTVALADKLDQLVGFFTADERPTGSSDPFALRRAALGIIRLVRQNHIRINFLTPLVPEHFAVLEHMLNGAGGDLERLYRQVVRHIAHPADAPDAFVGQLAASRKLSTEILDFLTDRLRVQLRAEGARHDIVAASLFGDDDILRILARAEALKSLVESEDGTNLLAAYKRAQNILRIEDKKDGPHSGPVDEALLTLPQEQALNTALAAAETAVAQALAAENFPAAMATLASLRAPVDDFFEQTMVNDADPSLRRNRLRLLSRLRTAMDQVADLSKIES